MGNQLFQFAAAKGLQDDPEAPAILDDRLRDKFGQPLATVLKPTVFRTAKQLELLKLDQMPRLLVGQRTALRMASQDRPLDRRARRARRA